MGIVTMHPGRLLAILLVAAGPLAMAHTSGVLVVEAALEAATLQATEAQAQGPLSFFGVAMTVGVPSERARIRFVANETDISEAWHGGSYTGFRPSPGVANFSKTWQYRNTTLGPSAGASIDLLGVYSYWYLEATPLGSASASLPLATWTLAPRPPRLFHIEPTPPKVVSSDPGRPGEVSPRHAPLPLHTPALGASEESSTLAFSGELSLRLFDINITVAHSKGTTTYRSGYITENHVAANPIAPEGVRHDVRETFLDVRLRDGRIEYEPARRPYVLDLASANVSTNASLVLSSATGTIRIGADRSAVSGADVRISPHNLQVTVAARAGEPRSLEANLRGTAHWVQVAGTTYQPLREGGPFGVGGWMWLGVGIPILAGLVALRIPLQRARAQRMFGHFGSNRFEEASALASSLRRSRHFRFDAAAVKVESLLNLGDVLTARRFVAELPKWPRRALPLRALLEASIAAQAGQLDAAARHLETCVTLGPEYAGEVATNPRFRGLLDRPGLRSLLRPALGGSEGYT